MNVTTEQRGAVRILAIDRERRRNALDSATAAELERAVRDAGDDPDTHALVLTGVGEILIVVHPGGGPGEKCVLGQAEAVGRVQRIG